MISTIRKSKFIHKFKNKFSTIICPEFYILAWAHRCNFEPKCSYCYLALTFRYEREPIVYTNVNDMINEVETWLEETKEPSVLNCGELSDSFALKENKPLADLMNLFEKQDRHLLLFLTKNEEISKEIEENAYNQVYKQTIFSFSINSQAICELYEKGAPNSFRRLTAAYRLKKQNQRVRIRIDPIIEIKDYKEEYKNVIDVVNEFVKPERVTLGSLRFFKNLQNFSDEKELFARAIDNHDEDKRMRIELSKRADMYQHFIDNLKIDDIALCKETLSCYKLMNRKVNECNCMI